MVYLCLRQHKMKTINTDTLECTCKPSVWIRHSTNCSSLASPSLPPLSWPLFSVDTEECTTRDSDDSNVHQSQSALWVCGNSLQFTLIRLHLDHGLKPKLHRKPVWGWKMSAASYTLRPHSDLTSSSASCTHVVFLQTFHSALYLFGLFVVRHVIKYNLLSNSSMRIT